MDWRYLCKIINPDVDKLNGRYFSCDLFGLLKIDILDKRKRIYYAIVDELLVALSLLKQIGYIDECKDEYPQH